MNFIRIAARVAMSIGTCVYVDLDETLIHTVILDDRPSVMVFTNYPGEKLQIGKYGVMLRPGAIELLKSLRGLNFGPIYLLTHSVSEYANTISEAFGFDVDEIFPRESLIGKVGRGENNFVLIDDLDSTHLVFQMKAQAMGIPLIDGTDDVLKEYFSKWHIQPSGFVGDPSDNGLDGIADMVAIALGVA
jgi:hypothetical protein